MSDALCGPSNALQTMQKHTTTDRSLQQDRLNSRSTYPGTFRSLAPHLSTHAEIEAFQTEAPSDVLHGIHPELHEASFNSYRHQQGRIIGPELHQTRTHTEGWASNFHTPVRGQEHGVSSQQTVGNSQSSSSWNHEFLRQQTDMPIAANSLAHHRQPMLNYMGYHNQPQPQNQFQMRETASASQFDELAFEQAFAAASMSLNDIQLEDSTSTGLATKVSELSTMADKLLGSTLEMSEEAAIEALVSIGAQESGEIEMTMPEVMDAEMVARTKEEMDFPITTEPPQTATDQKSPVDHDEMSRTAGALLDSVSNDSTTKFQQSKFLDLMRKFRDKEVRVEGKDIVGATDPAVNNVHLDLNSGMPSTRHTTVESNMNYTGFDDSYGVNFYPTPPIEDSLPDHLDWSSRFRAGRCQYAQPLLEVDMNYRTTGAARFPIRPQAQWLDSFYGDGDTYSDGSCSFFRLNRSGRYGLAGITW